MPPVSPSLYCCLRKTLSRKAAFAIVVTLMTSAACGQVHEVRRGHYTLRSSVVQTTMLPEEALRAHGVTRAPDRGVLNVVVLRNDSSTTLPVKAEITAAAFDLNGRPRLIDLHPAIDNGMRSYLGTFEFLPREVLDFAISAQPEGSAVSLSLAYRERMWRY